MSEPTRLTLIGYWDGPHTDNSWPAVESFVDSSWDAEERDDVAYYLSRGLVAVGFMGYSRCRFCGENNGNLELSDGVFIWPEGLGHYLIEHGVRLPDEFVRHTYEMIEKLETAERDVDWWRTFKT